MLRSLLVTAAVTTALATGVTAQTVPTGFVIDTVINTGLQTPHDFCFLADGRVLFANKAGPVQIWAGSAVVTIGTVPNVQGGAGDSERGLLSIAADPDFTTNGYVYVWYASTADSFMHLDRFTCTGAINNPTSTAVSLDVASRRVVLGAVPDNAFNHNGGALRFGPDDMLYLAIGDDAVQCNAQSTTTSVGCLLRMNVAPLPPGGSLAAPAFSTLDPGNNPLSANADISQLVIANGLRNPFRLEIDQVTGNVYIGDVGSSGGVKVEEYCEYVMPAPPATLPLVNFGWPWREGTNVLSGCGGTAPAGMVPPIAGVGSGAGWQAVVAGPRYRNQGGTYDFGPAYEGNGFYLDYFAGQLRRLVNTGAWAPAPAVPGQPDATNWGIVFTAVSSMRQGPDGGIWFTQHTVTYQNGAGGFLKRIRPLGPTNSVTAISGSGQIGPATEPFGAPLVARVFDTTNNPLPSGTVNFSVVGPATLSTVNPVIADANGYVQTFATATNNGGGITVTASTPGSQTNGVFSLFSRKLTAAPSGTLLVLSTTNSTTAVPAQIPYVLMVSWPGSPTLPTIIGPICTDPGYYMTAVIEDGVGMFGGVSYSGSGGVGTPSKVWIYQNVPPGLFAGHLMRFQAIGFDPVTGWFRTNCETRQF